MSKSSRSYRSAKRSRELLRQKKQEEKRRRRFSRTKKPQEGIESATEEETPESQTS